MFEPVLNHAAQQYSTLCGDVAKIHNGIIFDCYSGLLYHYLYNLV